MHPLLACAAVPATLVFAAVRVASLPKQTEGRRTEKHGRSFPGPLESPPQAPAKLFELAFFINADDSAHRRQFMERQLADSGVAFERWPAIRGGPNLLKTHERYLQRGVEKHLYLNKSAPVGPISGWGTIAVRGPVVAGAARAARAQSIHVRRAPSINPGVKI